MVSHHIATESLVILSFLKEHKICCYYDNKNGGLVLLFDLRDFFSLILSCIIIVHFTYLFFYIKILLSNV